MTDVAPVNNVIQSEEIASRKAVSESFLTRIAQTVNYMAQNAIEVIGEVKSCYLTEAQFAAQKGYDHTVAIASRKWAIMSGQSISGSTLNTLTGIATLPDMTTTGRFLGQKRAGDTLGQVEANQNISHHHRVKTDYSGPSSTDKYKIVQELTGSGDSATTPVYRDGVEMDLSGTPYIENSGGDQAKPETLRLNFFIKINN